MKRLSLLILGLAIIFSSCSNISEKPVSEILSTDELSKAIKSDSMFTSFYENIRKSVDEMDDIKKAKFNDVTYDRFFEYYKFLRDTTYWKPLSEKSEKEWEKEFGIYSTKADSTINYWKKYLAENSLDKYVKIELAKISKEYYDYIGELKEVNLGFRMTPLQGTVQQIRFNYGYKAKIHGDDNYYEKHRCIETDPLSSSRIGYWEVGYSDKDKFAGKNVETFLRDYNVYIEVVEIRKDGVNMSTDHFAVPEEVTKCLEVEKEYPSLFDLYKEDLIKKLIRKDYTGKWEYINKKAEEIQEKEDKLCYDFLKELYK
ncbi:MAG: hypothetical protein CVU07_03270 [Bacteroidetes bacterium HGW-Bacteroidetes-23]|nr:MAG: hypothetical protein CVU07_03270 [Bacteroidetes bacterium HGW-Bacteroidetes-23]